MQRFYFPEADFSQNIFVLKNKEIINQLIKVLRSKIWDEIIFFDWKTNIDNVCKIELISNKEISFRQTDKIEKIALNRNSLNLYQALPNKSSKMELILQKWVEVWFDNFTFFPSNRSQKLFLNDKKVERLNKIIIEAVEQSGRNNIPLLSIQEDLSKVRINKYEQNVFFHTNKTNSQKLSQINNTVSNTNIFVWPEWWWDTTEESNFQQLWFTKVYLWETILRTETVWIVVCFYLKQ